MVDTITITRVTGRTLSETAGQYVGTTVEVYSGKARLQMPAYTPHEATPTAAHHEYVQQRAHVQVPISATGIQTDDVVTVTAALDPENVGKVLRVAVEQTKTHATMRRLPVVELMDPVEDSSSS